MQQTIYKFSLVNGQMAVQQEGVYYVFAQVFFENYPDASSIYHNRVELTVNGVRVALMQHPSATKQIMVQNPPGQSWSWILGDRIGLKTTFESFTWLTGDLTFFGAYRIDLSDGC